MMLFLEEEKSSLAVLQSLATLYIQDIINSSGCQMSEHDLQTKGNESQIVHNVSLLSTCLCISPKLALVRHL